MVGVDVRAQPSPAPEPDDVQRLLVQIEHSVEAGDVFGYLDLVAGTANRARAIDFSRSEIQPGATRAVIKERDRIPFGSTVSPDGYRLVVDVFVEFSQSGREATWRLDVQRLGGVWQIFDAERLTVVEHLFRISLDEARQFNALNLTISVEDLDVASIPAACFSCRQTRASRGSCSSAAAKCGFIRGPRPRRAR